VNSVDLISVYKESLRYLFRHHPRKEYILEALETNQLTLNEIDDLFNEAEYYTMQYLFKNTRVKF